jgi:DNA-binding response OmpR family regulator
MEEKRVLIIEANPVMLDMLEDALEERGYSCIMADNVEEALQHVRSFEPDLVLLDLNLPKIDGTAFLKLARSYLPSDTEMPPVIVISAQNEKEITDYVHQLGASDILVKPFKATHLLAVIDHYVTH